VLRELYVRRRAGYQRYVERYFRGSWEEAILAWWHERTTVGQEPRIEDGGSRMEDRG
jgi:hypothetical protein